MRSYEKLNYAERGVVLVRFGKFETFGVKAK